MHHAMKSLKKIYTRSFSLSSDYIPVHRLEKAKWCEVRKQVFTKLLAQELEQPVEKINFEQAVCLVQCGADPAISTEHDDIRLLQFLAGRAQYNQLTGWLLDNYPELVHDVCVTGSGALHNAVRVGNLEIVKKIIISGADVNKQDMYGFTPLHTLAYFNPIMTGDVARIALVLKQHGADLKKMSDSYELSSGIAKRNGNEILYKILCPKDDISYTNAEK
jgi:ankyrin repeat protein